MAQNAAAHPGPGASALPPFEQLAARRTAKVAEIETALANGKSTKLARENLRDIDRKQAAVLAEEAAASTKQLAERGEQLDKDSLQLTDQALARVRDALVQPDHPPPGIRLEDEGAISHAAQHLTHVKAEASLADVVLRGMAEEVNVLRARRDTAAAALHEVQARRMNGATDDGDAETVSLLALDAEGLGALLAEAESRHRLATEPATAARQMVAKAAAELAQAEETAVMRALVLEADAIAAALLEVVDRIEELRARTGHARPLWNVTLPLYRLARRSAAAFGHL